MTVPIVEGVWLDTAGRHDTRGGTDLVTPLTPDDERLVLLAQLRNGIKDFESTRTTAVADRPVATAKRVTAATLQTNAAAFVAAAAYSKPQSDGLADGVETLADLVQELLAWRTAVDGAIIQIANALIWLGRTVGRDL